MHLPRVVMLMLFVVSISVLPGCLGCAGEPEPLGEPPEIALRARFSEHAARVLGQEEPFVATAQGFVISPPTTNGTWRNLNIELPRDGSGAIRFWGAGFEVRVREVGVEGAGELAEQAVAYRRPGGTSFWTTVPGGVEEWLHLEAGVARNGEAVAAWEIEGADVQQVGEAVDVIDAGGVARMRITAPAAYAAGGREVRARLEGLGTRIELRVDAGGQAVLVDPLWMPAGSMITERGYHTATLINGQVLVVGGIGLGAELSSAELYSPTTNSWTEVAPANAGRSEHDATLLLDGRVLVTGGTSGAQGELYDPATNAWTAAGVMMNSLRIDATATLLPSGRVLVTGGWGGGSLSSTELYDPSANTWAVSGSLNTARYGHTASLLPNGDVLVTGGDINNTVLASAERYNSATETWTPTAPLNFARFAHTATLLNDGQVLVVGDNNVTAELYNPVTETWALTFLNVPHTAHTATLLLNGKVLVAGGTNNGVAELYNPATAMWTVVGSLSTARSAHTATKLQDGSVLMAGGLGSMGWLNSAELYSPAPVGAMCAQPSDCESGFCADGVCCNTACNAGHCDACSIAAGAPSNGTCAWLNGVACNDGNVCTEGDICYAGACIGDPIVCPMPDQCHNPGTCNPFAGCSYPDKINGTLCDDDDDCTHTDQCQMGTCVGSIVDCMPLDGCHVGTCDPSNGQCSNLPLDCSASGPCEEDGTCDPVTGECAKVFKANGTVCLNGSCINGSCTRNGDNNGMDPTGTVGAGESAEQELDTNSFYSCASAPRSGRSIMPALTVFGSLVSLTLLRRRRRRMVP